ncbi:MAG: Gfo/Idh/MocA family oxidoreductase, partial [Gemmatimonadetes bacterium]|nr:Gfo/Idh/MocA family oxidoreductase [Gemmatimonadota bacterium]NIR78423.1 Gfo/Idh/MocA family oxidoreductase [Gemmatimonadota bacterium]NIT87035.1 Gfo/Idh/MocA family oxidoreductase [Gemmatimonadota bacterium]NIU30873.1 Gfo/Idh/MocA family oxidoreductase [Gemmatimonadota bacterium]NIU35642.1 Gfo/Idh/MocA family oxidoreductase [Gemmatimonadota bacterium]
MCIPRGIRGSRALKEPVPGRPLTVGVVGVGSLGFHHARILRDLEGVRFEGFWEIRRERAQEVARTLGVRARPSLDDLLERVEAVVVAVPTTEHERVALGALERGIHVLVEKPIAPSLAAADRILEAGKAHGALVVAGHVERFNPAVIAAERYLESPLFIESHRLAPFAPRGTDVAVVLDLMIHDVDLVESLVGTSIREIAATGVPVLTPSADIANARLTFEGGAVANLTASRVSLERMRKLRIFQPSGYLSLDLDRGKGEFLRLKDGLPRFAEPGATDASPGDGLEDVVERIALNGHGGEPLALELANFRDAVLGSTEPAVPGRAGRDALAISLAIEERIMSHVAD